MCGVLDRVVCVVDDWHRVFQGAMWMKKATNAVTSICARPNHLSLPMHEDRGPVAPPEIW